MNHKDEYSFFFELWFEDGQMLEVSFDSEECDEEARHHAFCEISHTYPDATQVNYLGHERNY